jgi:hypothetical protein
MVVKSMQTLQSFVGKTAFSEFCFWVFFHHSATLIQIKKEECAMGLKFQVRGSKDEADPVIKGGTNSFSLQRGYEDGGLDRRNSAGEPRIVFQGDGTCLGLLHLLVWA